MAPKGRSVESGHVFAGEQAAIFVEGDGGDSLTLITSPTQIDDLLARLNRRGLREKVLPLNIKLYF